MTHSIARVGFSPILLTSPWLGVFQITGRELNHVPAPL